jgi:hypothetical protein
MSKRASNAICCGVLCNRLLAAATALGAGAVIFAAGAAAAQTPVKGVPALESIDSAWLARRRDWAADRSGRIPPIPSTAIWTAPDK